jgi:hypothetical protein
MLFIARVFERLDCLDMPDSDDPGRDLDLFDRYSSP